MQLLPQPHGFKGVVAVGEQSANPPRANAADLVIGTAGSSRFARPSQAVPVPAMPENGPRTDNLRARAYQGVVRHGFRRARPPIADWPSYGSSGRTGAAAEGRKRQSCSPLPRLLPQPHGFEGLGSVREDIDAPDPACG